MNVAALQRVDGVGGGNDLVANLLDFGVVQTAADRFEVGIRLEIYDLVLIEGAARGVVVVITVVFRVFNCPLCFQYYNTGTTKY